MSERAALTVMLITVLLASCAEAALLTHDADLPGLRAKVTKLTHCDIHTDIQRLIQPADTIAGSLLAECSLSREH